MLTCGLGLLPGSEVEQEQDAANVSAAEVLSAFGELVLLGLAGDQETEEGQLEETAGGQGSSAGGGGSKWHQFHELVGEVQHRVRHRQLLQVRGQQLQWRMCRVVQLVRSCKTVEGLRTERSPLHGSK